MINLELLFSVLVGGVLTLLGTLLANYLQYRVEKREMRKERAKERFAEIRRYLAVCLEFADLVSIPTVLGPREFGSGKTQEWIRFVSDHYDNWKSLPANTSARVLLVEDERVLQWLEEIDQLKMQFYFNYQDLIKTGRMISLEDKRKELKQLTVKVAARLDQLLDRT